MHLTPKNTITKRNLTITILANPKDKTNKQIFEPNQISIRNQFDNYWKHLIVLRLYTKIIPNKTSTTLNQKFKIPTRVPTPHFNKITTNYKTQSIQVTITFLPFLDLNEIITYKTKQNKTKQNT